MFVAKRVMSMVPRRLMALRLIITDDKLCGAALPIVLGGEVFATAKVRGSEASGLALVKYVIEVFPDTKSGLTFNSQPIVS